MLCINALAAPLGLKLSWLKTKLQNVGAGNPPSTILIDGVPVGGAEEFIYLGSKQSSNGYCRPDVRLVQAILNTEYQSFNLLR